MIIYKCDGCRKQIPKGALRYTVQIDVRAAYEKMEVGLTELVQDHREEMLRLIDRLKDKSPSEVEESIYKSLKLDLCPNCQRAYIADPLHFHPEQGTEGAAIDIDTFLKSLGYGKARSTDEDDSPLP